MPDELERDLERALAGLPGPSPEVTERALRSSLDALPEPAPRRRKWRGPVMLGIAAAAVLTAAGVTLAATGSPPFSAQKPEHHTPTTVVGPASAHVSGTVATFADGRLWLGRTRGRPFSAVELSPGGLYAAVGEPGRLSVYTPDLRRRVWSQRVNGSVVAISWRPIGTQIAYIVHTAGGDVLHLIEADGDHDQVVPTGKVAPVAPSWRWDSQAFAYVGAGGRAAVYDLVHQRSTVLHVRCAAGAVESVVFAPPGSHQGWLAGSIAGNDFAADTATGRVVCFAAPPFLLGPAVIQHIQWTASGELLVAQDQFIGRLRLTHHRVVSEGYAIAPKAIAGIAPSPDGGDHILVAMMGIHSLQEVVATLPPRNGLTTFPLPKGEAALHLIGGLQALPIGIYQYRRPPQLIWR